MTRDLARYALLSLCLGTAYVAASAAIDGLVAACLWPGMNCPAGEIPTFGAETATAPDFDAILTGIKRELVNGNVPGDIRGLYAAELAAMQAQRPDLRVQAEAALTEAAA